jgi:hypothetical protein
MAGVDLGAMNTWELHEGRRRPIGTREFMRRVYVASCIGDGYESLDSVVTDFAGWAAEDGAAPFSREDIVAELAALIDDGCACAYRLSSQPPYKTLADFRDGVEGLWFTLTDKGVEMLRSVDRDAGHSPWYD